MPNLRAAGRLSRSREHLTAFLFAFSANIRGSHWTPWTASVSGRLLHFAAM